MCYSLDVKPVDILPIILRLCGRQSKICGLIDLIEEISKQSNVQAVIYYGWPCFLKPIYSENQEKKT